MRKSIGIMSQDEIMQHFYESITLFKAAAALTLILLLILYMFYRDVNLPPGPTGLPFFGYWPFLTTDNFYKQLQELSIKYGDILSLQIAGKLYIQLSSIKVIKEAFLTKTEFFGGRPLHKSIFTIAFGEGVAFVNGEPQKVLRKFFVSKFKECGMNGVKEHTADSIYGAMKELTEELRDAKGQPILITDITSKKCIVIIRRILFNDQGITLEELQELNDIYAKMATVRSGKNMLLFGNIAKYLIFPFMPNMWKFKNDTKRIEKILYDLLKRRKLEYNVTQVGDIIDSYIKERDDRRKKGDPTAAYLTDKALVRSLILLVVDGVFTVGVFVGIFLLKLVEYPEEQEKIYQEIVDVVGRDRLPTLEDKKKLPYTNAFIYEVSRLSEFIPTTPSLECTKKTTLSGYTIPKGSITLTNMYAANRNPKDFENPDIFDPSRYMETADKPRAELPILFGVGKRACFGEAFSMIQTFLFLTSIVQNFHLSVPEGSQGSFTFWSKERSKICAFPRSENLH